MIDSHPFFSVIIPTLNEEKFLPKLLSNLSQQKAKNFEVIITDGGSSDKTRETAKKYKKEFDLQFYLNQKKNVSYQRNFGADKAKGEYLIFLDADTGINSTFTSALRKFIEKKPGLVLIPYVVPDKRDSQTVLIFKIVNYLIELSPVVGKPFSAGGNMVWEKYFFQKIGGFNEKLFVAEDHNIIQKAYLWGVKPKFLNTVKVKFSLRRMRREGQFAYFYKYLISTAHILVKGDINKKIYDYEMGGNAGKQAPEKLFTNRNFQLYLNKIKDFFALPA